MSVEVKASRADPCPYCDMWVDHYLTDSPTTCDVCLRNVRCCRRAAKDLSRMYGRQESDIVCSACQVEMGETD